MSIVLNEYAWAKDHIEKCDLGDNAFETLCRVAKYYKANGAKKSVIKKNLEDFLLRCDPYVSTVLWSKTLDKAVKIGNKYPLVDIDKIVITKPEMDTILSAGSRNGGIQVQRLAFTLLCVAKYMLRVAPNTNGWVSIPEDQIMKMANLKPSYKRQNLLYGQLIEAGLLQPSKKIDNLNVRVLYIKDGEPALDVCDFRDLGNQFMKYIGKPYYVCQNCGLTVKAPKNAKLGKMKYCQECAVKIEVKNRVDCVMRSRKPARSANTDVRCVNIKHDDNDVA